VGRTRPWRACGRGRRRARGPTGRSPATAARTRRSSRAWGRGAWGPPVPGGGGRHDEGGLRGLRRAGLGALALARPSGDLGQPRSPQGREGAGTARGAGLRAFVPAALLSPDSSPIEEAFSKVKAHLRKAAARTRGALVEVIGRALDAVTARDARGWFGHCGYPLGDQPSLEPL
jgi:hypothetical protein